ncbi:MAG: hypothetical protein HC929_04885 [Leptolyngbyaceae cyanobacterium SM2_5_2]|nr:hypothetical protein [Leptolyngbyaceae cyanobacterium SM2_5_2]
MHFPLWPYLNQPLFNAEISTILNPWKYWHIYKIWHCERCWHNALLEACWHRDYWEVLHQEPILPGCHPLEEIDWF